MTKNRTFKLCVMVIFVVSLLDSHPSAFGKAFPGGANFSTTDAAFEAQIATFMKQDSSQRRSSLTYNAILARVARRKAYDMGRRHYYAHDNPEGVGFYDLIKQARYEPNGGGECIMASSETAEEAWDAWMNSPGHRRILLGLTSKTFFAANVEYGVGHAYVPGSPWGHYWVVIVAAPKKTGSSSAPNFMDLFGPKLRNGATSPYPNVIRGANGKLRPASGYVWANKDNPNDFRVRLMPGLIKLENGNFRPAKGYTWANPNNPNDLRVKPVWFP